MAERAGAEADAWGRSVQTWLPGTDATAEDPSASTGFARDLAALIARLRSAGARGRTFRGVGRGGHLRDHDEWMESCFRESVGLLDVTRLRAMWAELRTLPEVDAEVMCHGDLIPPNVLVRGSLATCCAVAPARPGGVPEICRPASRAACRGVHRGRA